LPNNAIAELNEIGTDVAQFLFWSSSPAWLDDLRFSFGCCEPGNSQLYSLVRVTYPSLLPSDDHTTKMMAYSHRAISLSIKINFAQIHAAHILAGRRIPVKVMRGLVCWAVA
jgi:hypothetical protein